MGLFLFETVSNDLLGTETEVWYSVHVIFVPRFDRLLLVPDSLGYVRSSFIPMGL